MARVVARAFKSQNITISTGTKVENVEVGKSSVKFTYGDESAEVDYLMIAGGRAPDVEALGLDALGVKTGDGGKIEVDGTPEDLRRRRLRDRRHRPRPGARAQGLRRGHRRGRVDRRDEAAPDRHRPRSPAPPSATRRSARSG